jgi:hypothetical protein
MDYDSKRLVVLEEPERHGFKWRRSKKLHICEKWAITSELLSNDSIRDSKTEKNTDGWWNAKINYGTITVVWRTSDHVSILSLGPRNKHTFVAEVELLCAYALMRRFQCRGRGTEVHDSEQKEAMYLPGWQEGIGRHSQQALARLHIRRSAGLSIDKPTQVACHRYSRLVNMLGTVCSIYFCELEVYPWIAGLWDRRNMTYGAPGSDRHYFYTSAFSRLGSDAVIVGGQISPCPKIFLWTRRRKWSTLQV